MLAQPFRSDPTQPTAANDAESGWLSAARDMAVRWVEAFNAGDVDALAALYDPDAVMFPTGNPTPVVGAEALRRYLAGLNWNGAAVALTDVAFTRLLSYRAAMTVGNYDFSRPEGDTRAILPARYSFVLTRHDDAWRIVHHHSSAAPAPRR